MTNQDKILLAKSIVESEPDEALRLCNEILNDAFDETEGQMALFMSAYIMMMAEKFGLAYHILQRCAQLAPNRSEIYSNMGMCLEEKDPERAKQIFKKAFKLSPSNYQALANWGLMCLQTGDPYKCIELSNKALEISDAQAALHNRSLARLMVRDWDGWDDYHKTLGVKHRERRDYGKPEWNGEPGTVLVYGEQGVGDEIMFASCLPDLLKTNKVVFDCDSRLEGFFKRSFDCDVFGDRFKRESRAADCDFDYQLSIGQLPYFYRRSEESFPGTPYLTPDPERCIQWRALFDTFPGRKIGVAWRGGLPNTGEKKRSLELDDLAPLFDTGDTYISLEYKPHELKYGIKSYMRATGKGQDIDELAALVNELDLVITACTTVVYVAGALGIPCIVMVPKCPGYRYHIEGGFPWYNSVELIRQRSNWKEVIEHAKGRIHEKAKVR